MYNNAQNLSYQDNLGKKIYLISGCKFTNSNVAAVTDAADPQVRYTIKSYTNLPEFIAFVRDTMAGGDVVEYSQPFGAGSEDIPVAGNRYSMKCDKDSPTAVVYRVLIDNPVFGACLRNFIVCFSPIMMCEG